jgi:arsenate reductase-like glutaredoxin family protein
LFTTWIASARDALSTRSKAYREMGLDDRHVDDCELLELMTADPTLIRRPLLVSGTDVVSGFDRERFVALVERHDPKED